MSELPSPTSRPNPLARPGRTVIVSARGLAVKDVSETSAIPSAQSRGQRFDEVDDQRIDFEATRGDTTRAARRELTASATFLGEVADATYSGRHSQGGLFGLRWLRLVPRRGRRPARRVRRAASAASRRPARSLRGHRQLRRHHIIGPGGTDLTAQNGIQSPIQACRRQLHLARAIAVRSSRAQALSLRADRPARHHGQHDHRRRRGRKRGRPRPFRRRGRPSCGDRQQFQRSRLRHRRLQLPRRHDRSGHGSGYLRQHFLEYRHPRRLFRARGIDRRRLQHDREFHRERQPVRRLPALLETNLLRPAATRPNGNGGDDILDAATTSSRVYAGPSEGYAVTARPTRAKGDSLTRSPTRCGQWRTRHGHLIDMPGIFRRNVIDLADLSMFDDGGNRRTFGTIQAAIDRLGRYTIRRGRTYDEDHTIEVGVTILGGEAARRLAGRDAAGGAGETTLSAMPTSRRRTMSRSTVCASSTTAPRRAAGRPTRPCSS